MEIEQQLIQIQKPRFEEQARILETTTFTQIDGKLQDADNGRCAMGVFFGSGDDGLDDLGTRIPYLMRYEIQRMNDQGKSFKEIAQWLRCQE